MPFEEDEKANFVLIISALNFMIFISITSISGSKQQSRTAKIIEKKMLKKKKFFKIKKKTLQQVDDDHKRKNEEEEEIKREYFIAA